jgi:hypothetical protein
MTTIWKIPDKLFRGIGVDGVDAACVKDLNIAECWQRVATITSKLATTGESISVVCEIWPDTGRIIWVVKCRRELCRVVLTSSEIEREYFSFANSNNFEFKYKMLVSQLKQLIRESFDAVDISFADQVSIMDSDDTESAEFLLVDNSKMRSDG